MHTYIHTYIHTCIYIYIYIYIYVCVCVCVCTYIGVIMGFFVHHIHALARHWRSGVVLWGFCNFYTNEPPQILGSAGKFLEQPHYTYFLSCVNFNTICPPAGGATLGTHSNYCCRILPPYFSLRQHGMTPQWCLRQYCPKKAVYWIIENE